MKNLLILTVSKERDNRAGQLQQVQVLSDACSRHAEHDRYFRSGPTGLNFQARVVARGLPNGVLGFVSGVKLEKLAFDQAA